MRGRERFLSYTVEMYYYLLCWGFLQAASLFSGAGMATASERKEHLTRMVKAGG